MRQLKRKEDPSGFLNMFRYTAAMMFGDPRGNIQGQGRQPNLTKAGPGRRRTGKWNDCRHGQKTIKSTTFPRGH